MRTTRLPAALELGGDGARRRGPRPSAKLHERRRNVELLAVLRKAAAHGVLATDGAHAPRSIWAIRAPSTAAHGLAPALGLVCADVSKYSWKVRYAFACSKACGHELGHALYDGEVGAGELVCLA